MRDWSYGINALYKTASVYLEEAPWYVFLLRKIAEFVCDLIHSQTFCVYVHSPILGFYYKKTKVKSIPVDYDKLKEVFYEEDREFWDEREAFAEKIEKEDNSEITKRKMKVVINSCYGGFGLSYEGVMYYAKLKGIKLYAYVKKWEDDLCAGEPYDPHDETIIPYEKRKSKGETPTIHYATKEGLKTREELKKYYWDPDDIKRDDPALVKTVEDLGEKANDRFAELKIVEIPDDVEWEITEYDGWEQVEEKHRVWS